MAFNGNVTTDVTKKNEKKRRNAPLDTLPQLLSYL